MKTTKCILLFFCLLISSAAFAYESPRRADLARLQQKRNFVFQKIEAEKDSLIQIGQDPTKNEKYVQHKRSLAKIDQDIQKLVHDILAEEIGGIKVETDKLKPQIEKMARLYFAHKIDFDEFLVFFKKLKSNYQNYAVGLFDYEISKRKQEVDHHQGRMDKVVITVNEKVKEYGHLPKGYNPNINDGTLKNISSQEYLKEIRKDVARQYNRSLSKQEQIDIQGTYDAAAKKFGEIDKEKDAAEIERGRSEMALNGLLKRCAKCKADYEARFKDQ